MRRLLIFSFLCVTAIHAQILAPILSGGEGIFTLSATTTGASQLVTVNRLTLAVNVTLSWGDGNTTAIIAGSTSAITHTYTSAGTYAISVPRARQITQIDLRGPHLGGLHTASLHNSAITYFSCTMIALSTISSADMAAWRPTTWYLYSMPTGGTYSISSADMAAWRPTTWYLYSMPTGGTYSISSADMAAWTGVQKLSCYFMPIGTVTIVAASNFTGMVAAQVIQFQGNALSQAQVDLILQGFWLSKALQTYTTPSLNVGGTNAAPSGTYASTCPPTTGKAYAYELVNGVCSGAGPKWTVTFTP